MASGNKGDLHYLSVASKKLEITKTEFHDIIENAVSKHASSTGSDTTRVDLVLLVKGIAKQARSQLFSSFQKLIADIYTLACVTAAEHKVELDFLGGLDIRLYAVDVETDVTTSTSSTSGPLTSLDSFKDSRANRDAETQLSNVLANTSFEKAVDNSFTDKKLHHKVAVGGTFDHLHIGHKLLLTMTVFAAQPGPEGREITVGITGDELLVNKKHASVLESWDVRQQRSADFVESILVFHPDIPSIRTIERIDQPGPNGKVVKVSYQTEATGKTTINYVRISDPFGPTITDESITALVISAETRAGGKAVNDKRNEKGWASLEVFEVDVLDPASVSNDDEAAPTRTSADFATKISSTEIRRRLAIATND